MKSLKNLRKQSIKAAGLSFKAGKLDEAVAKKFIKSFKALPLGESVPSLTYYLQAIKREIEKTTLTIFSASKLSSTQEKELENSFKKNHKILQTHSEITPSILGGVKVKIGDVIYDNSLKSRISQIKEVLTN